MSWKLVIVFCNAFVSIYTHFAPGNNKKSSTFLLKSTDSYKVKCFFIGSSEIRLRVSLHKLMMRSFSYSVREHYFDRTWSMSDPKVLQAYVVITNRLHYGFSDSCWVFLLMPLGCKWFFSTLKIYFTIRETVPHCILLRNFDHKVQLKVVFHNQYLLFKPLAPFISRSW